MPKVTQKGQVTIPQQIRIMLGIKTGDQVNFEVDAGTVYLRKKQASVKNLKRYVGYLSHLKGKEPEDIIRLFQPNSKPRYSVVPSRFFY